MKKLIFGLIVGLIVLSLLNTASASMYNKRNRIPIPIVPSATKSGSNSDAVFSAAFIKARENTFKELKQSIWRFSEHSTAKATDITGTNSAMYNMNWK